MDHPVVLFDGICNFCNATVQFILKRDKEQRLLFAPLQSVAGQSLLQQQQLPTDYSDSILLVEKGRVSKGATAALRLLRYFPWYWKALGIFWLVPAFIRNGIYNWIARNRYKWFGKKEVCMVPGPEVRKRFLDPDLPASTGSSGSGTGYNNT